MGESLYDRDFYTWANEQAALLRAGKLAQADIANIAEEIESMGRSEKRELVERLTALLRVLLQWQYQPRLRDRTQRLTIAEHRLRLDHHLADNPSLSSRAPEAMAEAWTLAVIQAQRDTGLSRSTFPATCSYPYEQVISPDFWPE